MPIPENWTLPDDWTAILDANGKIVAYDTHNEPIITYDDNGDIIGYIYCPYIPADLAES